VEGLRERLTANRAYTALGKPRSDLDDFSLLEVSLEGSFPDASLVVLFERPGQSTCRYGARSRNLWRSDPEDDWYPLDPSESSHTVEDVVEMLVRRMDMNLWPAEAGTAAPLETDQSGITWVDWQLGE